MSYSNLAGTRSWAHRVFPRWGRPFVATPLTRPVKRPTSTPIIAWRVGKAPYLPMNGMGLQGVSSPTINQLSKFLENYKGYVLAFSPATNCIAAFPQGMGRVAFTIKLGQHEPTDAGLSRARARIDGPGSLNGLGDFNPHTAWGNRYKAAPVATSRSGNGLRPQVPFFAGGVAGVTPIVLDPPIEQQEIRWDTPSLTLYMGSNKIALIPAILSALAVKVILMGGSKVATASKFWSASDKAAKKVARA